MTALRAQIEAITFQAVPGGYLYREPFRLSSKAQHYLVNEAQKAQLVALTIPQRPVLWQISLWSSVCAMVVIACAAVWLYTGHGNPTTVDAVGMIVLTAAQLLVAFGVLRWWKLRRLRPLLATLRPSNLKMTRSAIQGVGVNAMSVTQLVIAGVASACAATAALINGAIQLALRQPMSIFWLVLSLVFAGLAFIWFKRLKDRAEKADVTRL